MAEVLAVAGGVASFAQFTEYLVKGSLALRQMIKDVKSAPKDIKKLIDELEILKDIVKGVDEIIQQTPDAELKTRINDVTKAARKGCERITSELNAILTECETGIKKAGVKGCWEKVKVVKEKQSFATLLGEIERAKSSLVIAQQNVSSIVAQLQTEILSTSLDLARTNHSEISDKIETSLDQTRETLQISNATEQQIQRSMALQHRASGAQAEILARLVQVSDAQGQGLGQILQSLEMARQSGIEVSAKFSSVCDQGQAILTLGQITQQAVADSERRLRDELMEVKEMLVKPRPASREKQRFADTSSQETLETQISVPTSQDSETATFEIAPQSSSFVQRRTRWKETSHTWQRYTRYLSIQSVTRLKVIDNVSHAYCATETRVTVRSTLPFFKRVVKYTTLGTNGDPLFERKLRVVRMYTYDSAIYKALTNFDCDEARRLFLSGEASPFMECEQGYSLIDSLLTGICWRLNNRLGDLRIPNATKLLEFLIDVEGRGAARIGQSSFGSMLIRAFRDKRDLECVNQFIRLTINSASENLLGYVSSYVDLDNAQHPTIKIITQQNIWPVDLDFHGIVEFSSSYPRQRRSIVENQRLMLEDPNGDRLSRLLLTATRYNPLGSRPFEHGDESPICALLHIASTTRNMDIQECCKARLRILLSMPDCHKLMESETMEIYKRSIRTAY